MSHYYDRNTGFLLPSVELKVRPGEWRDPDLRDARKVGALPSVTTILSLLDKPGLDKWRITQGIKAAAKVDNWDWHLKETGELDPTVVQAVYEDSEAYTRWTQDFGTAVHWWINTKLEQKRGRPKFIVDIPIPPMMVGAEEVADGVLEWTVANGFSFTATEHRFTRTDLGYAGTVDLMGDHYGTPCIVDIKTQEPPLTPYLEHALQLAGYDYALPISQDWHDGPDGTLVLLDRPRERISLIANRLNPGEVKEHIWVDKGSTVEATNQRYDAIWLGLVDLWMMINKYDPRVEGAWSANIREKD